METPSTSLSNNRVALDAKALIARRKNRWMLIGVVTLFVGPILLAVALTSAGWRPANSKAYGMLIDPPRDVSAAPVTLADGNKYVWKNPAWQWTMLALPGPNCATQCRSALANVLRMRLTLGRNAERLRIVYLGEPLPADALQAFVPLQAGVDDANAFAALRSNATDSLSLALVDPGGYLMLAYASGFDVSGVRRDLPKVIN